MSERTWEDGHCKLSDRRHLRNPLTSPLHLSYSLKGGGVCSLSCCAWKKGLPTTKDIVMLSIVQDYWTKVSCCAILLLRSMLYDNTCFSAVFDSSVAQTSKECAERELWPEKKRVLFQWPVPSICLNTLLNYSRVFRHPVRADKQLQLGIEPTAKRPPSEGLNATSPLWVRAPLQSQPARRDEACHLRNLSTWHCLVPNAIEDLFIFTLYAIFSTRGEEW